MDSGYSKNCSSTSNLNKDVLSEVFGHLDYEELVQCEAVCRRWREILQSGPIWKRWFQKQLALSPSWREIWKKMAIDANALEPTDYRAICRDTFRQVKELNNNWCTGQFVTRNTLLHLLPSDFAYSFHFYDDWIAVHTTDFNQDSDSDTDYNSRMMTTYLQYFMKNSSHATECITIPPDHDFRCTDESYLICSLDSKINIFDRRIGKFTVQINSDDDHLNIECATLYNGLLGILYRYNGRFLLSVWNVENPSRIALLKQFKFDVRYRSSLSSPVPVSIAIDEQFIVVKGYVYVPKGPVKTHQGIWTKRRKEPVEKPPVVVAHFISTRTLEVKRSLTVDAEMAVYDKGLLFVLINERVQIYDVSSGIFYRHLILHKNASDWGFSREFQVSVNSKYVAILYRAKSRRNRWKTMLRVYKLEALKNIDADPNSLLLTPIENDSGPLSMMMDETRIVICSVPCIESNKGAVFVLDFSPSQTQ